MQFNERVDFYGVFSVKSLDKNNNVIDEYTEKNLIMNSARNNMAELVGGVTTSSSPINRFVIGTKGHLNDDIISPRDFSSERTMLFSEEDGSFNYQINFSPAGGTTIEDIEAYGSRYAGANAENIGDTGTNIEPNPNIVRRVVSDSTTTYTITIPASNANPSADGVFAIPYTEAALYAGDEIFSMKTFPARVKEETVSFEITWSIIF